MAVFGLEGVYVYRAIRRLGGDVLVQRIPSNALDIVIVLCNLSYQGACVVLTVSISLILYSSM